MIFDAHNNYANILKSIIPLTLTNITYSKTNDDFFNRLQDGKIIYKNDYFTGSLPKKDYDFLIKKLGAKQTKRGLYIKRYRLTNYYKQQIDKQQLIKDTLINNAVVSIADIYNNIDKQQIKQLSQEIYKRLAKNFTKEKLTFNATIPQIESKIITSLVHNMGNSIDFLLDKITNINQDLSVKDITGKINSLFFYTTKNTLLNTINENLFTIQSEEAEKNNIDSFYWWHRPTLRPTDRMYHREHYNQSKAGKKFHFKNLPTWNGKPDYPGRLWNCHCRAYIRKTEFDRASE